MGHPGHHPLATTPHRDVPTWLPRRVMEPTTSMRQAQGEPCLAGWPLAHTWDELAGLSSGRGHTTRVGDPT